MFRTLRAVELDTPQQESAYDQWLEQTSAREIGRQDRIHGAAGVMPTPLWIALFFISAIVLVFLFGFADSSERAWVQGLFMGGVVSVVVTMLLLLGFLDDPFQDSVGGLQPVAMERSVRIIDQALEVDRHPDHDPVRRRGRPRVTAAVAAAPDSPPQRDWIEIVATVLLAVAAVATAWSSYQANRWNGEQAKAASRANALAHQRGPRPRARGGPDAGRHRDCSSNGSTRQRPTTPSSPTSTSSASDPSSSLPSTPGRTPIR